MAHGPIHASAVAPLVTCPDCRIELRLFGTEAESEKRDIFTFECPACGKLEVRGVLVAAPFSLPN